MKRIACTALVLLSLLSATVGCAPAEDAPEPTPAPTEAPVVIELTGAAATATPTALPAPTPAPDAPDTPVSGPAPEKFSIVWISDTQHYSELYPDMLLSMAQWTSANREAYNIKALVHTGDMVNRSGSERQWANIGAALDALGDLPFLALAGNHDVGTSTLDYRFFLKHVASRYPADRPLFEQGRGSSLALPMDYKGFFLIGTGWGYSDASVAWLNAQIRQHPLDVVILCAHSYLNTNGTLTDGGDILFEQVVRANTNVRVVLSGHRDDVAFRTDPIDANGDGVTDRTVYTMLYNYQEVKKDGGGGYLRLLTIDPGKRTMDVVTYSPYFNDYKTGAAEQFTIENLF